MSAFKKLPKELPMTDVELLAASLLSTLYADRIRSVVEKQINGEVLPQILICFSEREHLADVLAAFQKVRELALGEAASVAVRASDEAKPRSREQNTAERILDQIHALKAENTFALAT